MLAFTIFALLAVGTVTVMNRGVASAQDALETTLVRQQIDGQVEALRFLYQSYASNPASPTRISAKTFDEIVKTKASATNASDYASDSCLQSVPGVNPFLAEPKSGSIISQPQLKVMNATTPDASAPAYAQVRYNDDGTLEAPYGMWIEAVQGGSTGQPQFIDFHIRACWFGATSETARKLGTIVRFYLPTTEKGQLVGVGTGIPQLKSYPLQGNAYDRCTTFGPQEVADTNPQRHALFENISPPSDPSRSNFCQRNNPTGMGDVVRSCVNYDAEYSPKIEPEYAGRYKLTINYLDSVCGSTSTPFFETIPSSYSYRVALYVDGNEVEQGILSPSTQTFTYSNSFLMNENTKIQLRWWNNRFIPPGNADPDFTINQLKLERISSE